MEKIIVSKHESVEKYLKEQEIVPGYIKRYPFVNEDFAKGKHIYGIVPMNIAALAGKFTEVKITLHHSEKYKEVSASRINAQVKNVRTYIVTELEEERIV